jgi:hypothetical protein
VFATKPFLTPFAGRAGVTCHRSTAPSTVGRGARVAGASTTWKRIPETPDACSKHGMQWGMRELGTARRATARRVAAAASGAKEAPRSAACSELKTVGCAAVASTGPATTPALVLARTGQVRQEADWRPQLPRPYVLNIVTWRTVSQDTYDRHR